MFGGVGLLLTSAYLIPQRIVMWSMGVSYFMQDDAAASLGERTRHRAVLRKTLTHPCILAVFVGMALMQMCIRDSIEAAGFDARIRPEALTLENFAAIQRAMAAQ